MSIIITGESKNEALVGYNINDGLKTEFEVTATSDVGFGVRLKAEAKTGNTDAVSTDALTQTQFKEQSEVKIPGEAEIFYQLPEGWRIGGGVIKPYRGIVANGLSQTGMKPTGSLLRDEYLPIGYQNPVNLDAKNSLGGSVQWVENGATSGGRFFVTVSGDGGSALFGIKSAPGDSGATETSILLPVDPENHNVVTSVGGGGRLGGKGETRVGLDGSVTLRLGPDGDNAVQFYTSSGLELANGYTRFAGDVSVVTPFDNSALTAVGGRLFVEQDLVHWKDASFSILGGTMLLAIPSESGETPVIETGSDNGISNSSGTAIIGQADSVSDTTPTQSETTATSSAVVINQNYESIFVGGVRFNITPQNAPVKFSVSPWGGVRLGNTIDGAQPVFGVTGYGSINFSSVLGKPSPRPTAAHTASLPRPV